MSEKPTQSEYCQSCGMPLRLDVPRWLGTDAGGDCSHEFCYYCMERGIFTVDVSMGQMVDIWVKYTDKYNDYAGTDYRQGELRSVLQKRLPTLNRWRQRLSTLGVHSRAVESVKIFIDQNLSGEITMEQLCRESGFSLYHLRRVFKHVTGENIGSYITRLRLEAVAHRLIVSRQTIGEILAHSSYQTLSSLSKAFHKHFGLSMTAYRAKYAPIETPCCSELMPQIKWVEPLFALCRSVGTSYRNADRYRALWSSLVELRQGVLTAPGMGNYLSLSLDNPAVGNKDRKRFYIGMICSAATKPTGRFSRRRIEGGLYAVFRCRGDYESLVGVYADIYEKWLPGAPYIHHCPMSFEVYLNSPLDCSAQDLVTDIYLPIKRI